MYANPEEALKEVQHARSMVRWMNIGVLPSQANMQRAVTALKAQAEYGLVDEAQLKETIKITQAMSSGIAPSVEKCREANGVLNQLMDRIREGAADTVRSAPRPSAN